MRRAKRAGLILWAALLGPAAGWAGTTQVHRIGQVGAFLDGELEGMALHSDGYLSAAPETLSRSVPQQTIWKMVWAKSAYYFITSEEAAVYRMEPGEEPTLLFRAEEIGLTSLAYDGKKYLLAGALGTGSVYRFALDAKPSESAPQPWASLPEEGAYVWALLSDGKGGWHAATGPEGMLYHIESDGTIEQKFDSPESNLMSLAIHRDGDLLAGSSDNGLLYRVDDDGRASVLYDFDENEISEIVPYGSDVWVAANESKRKRALPRGRGGAKKKAMEANGDQQENGEKPGQSANGAPNAKAAGRVEWLRGAVYRLDTQGRIEATVTASDQPVLGLAVDAEGTFWAGLGEPAQVFGFRDASAWNLIYGGDGAQIGALAVRDGRLGAFAQSEPAQILELTGDAREDAVFISPPIDAKFPARWGRIAWEGEGVKAAYRTGHTDQPGETYGEWSKWSGGNSLEVSSPYRRYLQLKVAADDEDDRLWEVRAYYAPANQRPELDQVTVTMDKDNGSSDEESYDNSRAGGNSPIAKVEWTASDPNKDKLSFEAFLRPMKDPELEVKLTRKPVTDDSFEWDTSGVSDGWYLIRVKADDGAAAAPGEGLAISLSSSPFLIDNTPPKIEDLEVDDNVLTGVASDRTGVIAQLRFRIDAGPWRVLNPKDGVLDEDEEAFEALLADLEIEPGRHILSVRAKDSAGNRWAEHVPFVQKR